MQVRFFAVTFAGFALLALVIMGCQKESGSNTSAGGSGTGDIVVGEYGSMTGSEATFGISTDDGAKLAVKERNAAGGVKGRQIKLIAYDDQGKQQEAVTAVTRLDSAGSCRWH